MSSENNSLAEMGVDFRLPAVMDGADFSNEDLADDMDGLRFNFQRVKIPSGGNLHFEVPTDDPENPDSVRTIEGVILHNHATCAYWPEGSEYDEDATPLCSSVDGKLGVGEPGGDCVTCALNKFDSDSNGRGKACKNMRILYLLRDSEFMPIQVTLPPTSIRPFSDFCNAAFAARRRGTCGSIVSIGLKKANNGKDDYSVATFRKVADFTGEQLAQAKAYSEGFKAQIKAINRQRVSEAATRADDLFDGFDTGSGVYGDESRFSVASPGAYIDGEREKLPA
jgi:hypothetical protein